MCAACVERLETTAGRLEKEFEGQFRALADSRKALREEARKQLRALRAEQRGLLGRLQAAAKPPSKKAAVAKTSAKKATAKNTAAKRGPAKRGTAKTTAAKASAAKR